MTLVSELGEGFRWSSAFETHVGKVRKLNEDAVLSRPDLSLWAVADGMGGHEGGDRASRMVIDALASLSPADRLGDFVDAAMHKLESVNAHLHAEARRGAGNISGSTVVALLVHGRRGAAVWAGDSRLYLFRNGSLHALSRDHSQVEEWVSNGLLERHQADGHPAANVITRAIGAADSVELDTAEFEIFPGDTFLLCSDGLYNELGEQAIARILGANDFANAAHKLLTTALAGAARDNISLVITHAEERIEDATRTVINPAFAGRPHLGED
ncbi:MAG: protein phosphatase 2C domain-containing protein [Chromatiaceae bacterium]|jgi:protein phosphatase